MLAELIGILSIVTEIEANMSSGQADRLKATLFPESNGAQATQIDTKPTNVQRLSAPSQDIKQSLCNLLKHQVSSYLFIFTVYSYVVIIT